MRLKIWGGVGEEMERRYRSYEVKLGSRRNLAEV